MVTLKYSRDVKIMLSILYDRHPQDALEEHEPRSSSSFKRTNMYLCAFQGDCVLAAVKAFNRPQLIVTRFSDSEWLELFEARLTVLRKEPSFARPRKQNMHSKLHSVHVTFPMNRGAGFDGIHMLSAEDS
jgi:hypothetical protein